MLGNLECLELDVGKIQQAYKMLDFVPNSLKEMKTDLWMGQLLNNIVRNRIRI